MKKMTDEDKDILYIDLCGRLPYCGLMVRWGDEDFNIIGVGFGRVTLLKPFMSNVSGAPLVEEVRPYLRPMSSMTEEEKDEYDGLVMCNASWVVDGWLLTHHFDFRGLIKKGLAIEAPEGMYKLEKN